MIYLLIPAGFGLLFLGGELLVRGAVGIAHRFGVSPMMIGATIVAYGTTAPELFVSLQAALAGAPGIAIGNVVGSNICNFLLILGASAVLWPISLARARSLLPTAVVLAGATLLLIALSWDGHIARWQGGLMVALLATMTIYNLRRERQKTESSDIFTDEAQEFAEKVPRSLPKTGFILLGGVAGVVVGAHLLVVGAVALARDAGIPEEVIGLTMVALGTSLPELATALVAAWRRHSDVALGTVFGANIYNILGIMGLVAAVTPVPVPAQMVRLDMPFLLGVTLLFLAGVRYLPQFGRAMGATFLAVYFAYVFWQYFGTVGFG